MLCSERICASRRLAFQPLQTGRGKLQAEGAKLLLYFLNFPNLHSNEHQRCPVMNARHAVSHCEVLPKAQTSLSLQGQGENPPQPARRWAGAFTTRRAPRISREAFWLKKWTWTTHRGSESQNHSMAGVGRDLCGSPSTTPCPSRVTRTGCTAPRPGGS